MNHLCRGRASEATTRVRRVRLALALLGGLLLTGCDSLESESTLRYGLRSDPLVLQIPDQTPTALAPSGKRDDFLRLMPSYGGVLADPTQLSPGQRQELTQTLEAMFGTPSRPRVPGDVPNLDLTEAHLAQGSQVYRRSCAQCHGVTGDGRGLSGMWVYPYPRDFRSGVFKSAPGSDRKPSFETLVRLVRRGVPGTIMQPHDLISEDEVRAVTAYVIHLSIRGEVELRILKDLLDETGEVSVSNMATACETALVRVRARWAEPETASPTLPPIGEPDNPGYEDSVIRGHQMYDQVGCAKCHEDFGRRETFRYDGWGHVAQVPDLTRGEYRWGREPQDLAARIRSGIPGSAMPAHPMLSEASLLDLLRFVRELPHPQRLPVAVRDAVYPARK